MRSTARRSAMASPSGRCQAAIDDPAIGAPRVRYDPAGVRSSATRRHVSRRSHCCRLRLEFVSVLAAAGEFVTVLAASDPKFNSPGLPRSIAAERGGDHPDPISDRFGLRGE